MSSSSSSSSSPKSSSSSSSPPAPRSKGKDTSANPATPKASKKPISYPSLEDAKKAVKAAGGTIVRSTSSVLVWKDKNGSGGLTKLGGNVEVGPAVDIFRKAIRSMTAVEAVKFLFGISSSQIFNFLKFQNTNGASLWKLLFALLPTAVATMEQGEEFCQQVLDTFLLPWLSMIRVFRITPSEFKKAKEDEVKEMLGELKKHKKVPISLLTRLFHQLIALTKEIGKHKKTQRKLTTEECNALFAKPTKKRKAPTDATENVDGEAEVPAKKKSKVTVDATKEVVSGKDEKVDEEVAKKVVEEVAKKVVSGKDEKPDVKATKKPNVKATKKPKAAKKAKGTRTFTVPHEEVEGYENESSDDGDDDVEIITVPTDDDDDSSSSSSDDDDKSE